MVTVRMAWVVLPIVLWAACKDRPGTRDATSSSLTIVAGLVVDSDGEPQAMARVTLRADLDGDGAYAGPGEKVAVAGLADNVPETQVTYTDDAGLYVLSEVVTSDTPITLEVEAIGFASYLERLQVSAATMRHIALLRATRTVDSNVADGVSVSLSGTDTEAVKVDVPASSLPNGVTSVSADITPMPSRSLGQGFPGGYMASVEGETTLESITMAQVTLYDQNGDKILGTATGDLVEPATLRMRVADDNLFSLTDDDPTTSDKVELPLWYLDEATGIWRQSDEMGWLEDADGNVITAEERVAIMAGEDTRATYVVGRVRHFSTWNCDRPVTTHNHAQGQLVDGGGSPVTGVTVSTEGVNYTGGGPGGTTDGGGNTIVNSWNGKGDIFRDLETLWKENPRLFLNRAAAQVDSMSDTQVDRMSELLKFAVEKGVIDDPRVAISADRNLDMETRREYMKNNLREVARPDNMKRMMEFAIGQATSTLVGPYQIGVFDYWSAFSSGVGIGGTAVYKYKVDQLIQQLNPPGTRSVGKSLTEAEFDAGVRKVMRQMLSQETYDFVTGRGEIRAAAEAPADGNGGARRYRVKLYYGTMPLTVGVSDNGVDWNDIGAPQRWASSEATAERPHQWLGRVVVDLRLINVTGRIISDGGVPYPDLVVTSASGGVSRTDADGLFTIEGPANSVATFYIYGTRREEIVIGDTDLDLGDLVVRAPFELRSINLAEPKLRRRQAVNAAADLDVYSGRVTYLWLFDHWDPAGQWDGQWSDAGSPTVVWMPPRPGRYQVTLVASSVGWQRTASSRFEVTENDAPRITGWSATSPTTKGKVTLVATASDPDGDSVRYRWSASVSGTFSAPNSATTDFTANVSESTTVTFTVEVRDARYAVSQSMTATFPPTAFQPRVSLNRDAYTAALGLPIEFIAASSEDVRYAWEFGDGSIDAGMASTAHLYDTAGTYTVRVTATHNVTGETATADAAVAIYAVPEILSLTASPQSGDAPLLVTLSAIASDADGSITQYRWSYGDSDEETGTSDGAFHLYTEAGTYTVTLVVRDDDYLVATASVDITVAVQPNSPLAELSADVASGPAPHTVTFTLSSSDADNDSLTCALDFGDDSEPATACTGSVEHTYATPGSYAAVFTADDGALSGTDGVSINVFGGTADTVFAAPLSYTVYKSPSNRSLFVTDVNGDGDADVGWSRGDELTILLGDGAGSFAMSATRALGGAGPIAVGQLVNGGLEELVVAAYDATTRLHVITPQWPTFGESNVTLSLAVDPVLALRLADFTGGSDKDVVALSASNVVRLYPNSDGAIDVAGATAIGNFTQAPQYPSGLAVGDVIGDSKKDIVVAYILTQAGTSEIAVLDGADLLAAPVILEAAGVVQDVAIADMTGDGQSDIVFPQASYEDDSELPTGIGIAVAADGGFAAPVFYDAGDSGPVSLRIADFNGDGRLDVLSSNSAWPASSVTLLLGNSSGGLDSGVVMNTGLSGFATMEVGDFNGDGRSDAVLVQETFADENTTLSVLLAE